MRSQATWWIVMKLGSLVECALEITSSPNNLGDPITTIIIIHHFE